MKRDFKRQIYCYGTIDDSVPVVKVGMAGDVEKRTKTAFTTGHVLHVFDPEKDGLWFTDSVFYHWLDKHATTTLYRPEISGTGRERFHIKDAKLLNLFHSVTAKDHQNIHGKFWSAVTDLMKGYELEWKLGSIGRRRTQSYAMRHEQKACVTKALSWFSAGNLRFLIAAKMRFGKTHTCYQIVKGLDAKRVLVLSFAPQAKSAWNEDLLGHIAFDAYQYHDYKDGAPPFADHEKLVCFSSMQALTTGNIWERKWVWETDWDVIIFDEEHIGTDTLRSNELITKLHCNYQLWVSGTAFRDITLAKFTDDNTFSWTYADEQEAKALELARIGPKFAVRDTDYQALPRLHMRVIKPNHEHQATLDELIDDRDPETMPSLAKVFAPAIVNTFTTTTTINPGFEHPAQAHAILSMLEFELSGRGFDDQNSIDHILVFVPGVREAMLIEQVMSISRFYSQYKIINATGDGEGDIDVAKRIVQNEPKTITLTCRRWCEAVTVPEWGTVVLLDEIRSPAQFWQTVFRVQGPFIDNVRRYHKRECYVISFSLEIILSQVYQLAYFGRKQDQTLEQSFKRILDTIPIYGSYLTKLEPISFDDAFMRGLEATNNTRKAFNGSSAISDTNLSDDLVMALMSVPHIDDIVASIEQTLHQSGIAKGKTSKRSINNVKHLKDEVLEHKNRILSALRGLEMLIPTFMYASSSPARTSVELTLMSGDEWDAKFRNYLGLNKLEFKRLIEAKAFNVRSLDDKIAAFSIAEIIAQEI